MHRDPTLRKRNALVIPGVLLMLVCLAGIVYAQAIRADDVECEDGRMVVFAGDCRSATLLLMVPLALGLLLVILGARIRGHNTCHLGHGTVATTGLAVLISLVLGPLLAAGALMALEDPDDPYVMTYADVDFGQARVLAGAGLAMLLLLVPYLALYIGTARPRTCCRDKGCFEPCFCDEDALPPDPAFPQTHAAAPALPPPPSTTAGETAQVTTSTWTGPPKREVQPLPPPGPRGAPAPAPAPAPLPAAPKEDPPRPLEHDAWPETHHHDTTFDAGVSAPPPAPLAPPPAEPAPQDWGAPGDEPAHKSKPKKAAAKKTRKVTRKKK